MTAYVFPGQGAQFPTMGQDLFEASSQARALFAQANSVLGFDITKIMFEGTPEDLKETRVTQPAVFLHSTILARVMGTQFRPDMVAGHSLGEFSALVASQAMAFDDGLRLPTRTSHAKSL
jgi:[acyl-carrier-protein] S-malonyltransferase